MQHNTLLILCGVLLLIVVLSTPWGQALAALGLGAAVVVMAYSVLVHTYTCPRTDAPCTLTNIQPTWAGPCFSSDKAGLIKQEGFYHLTASAGVDGRVTCADIRILR